MYSIRVKGKRLKDVLIFRRMCFLSHDLAIDGPAGQRYRWYLRVPWSERKDENSLIFLSPSILSRLHLQWKDQWIWLNELGTFHYTTVFGKNECKVNVLLYQWIDIWCLSFVRKHKRLKKGPHWVSRVNAILSFEWLFAFVCRGSNGEWLFLSLSFTRFDACIFVVPNSIARRVTQMRKRLPQMFAVHLGKIEAPFTLHQQENSFKSPSDTACQWPRNLHWRNMKRPL